MSKFGKILETVTSALGLNPKVPALPEPKVPAAPAPTARADAGASINIGSRAGSDRVSGGGNSSIGKKIDVLGSLGLGGLRI